MIPIFQLAVFGLIAVSFAMVVGVPVIFASPNGWTGSNGKNLVFGGGLTWFLLVFLVGILNSFIS